MRSVSMLLSIIRFGSDMAEISERLEFCVYPYAKCMSEQTNFHVEKSVQNTSVSERSLIIWGARLVAWGAIVASLVSSAAGQVPASAQDRIKTVMNSRDGLNYVWIPPGTFMMGCSGGDEFCRPSEKPAHPVTITQGFWIGQTHVTQAAYKKVMGTNPSRFQGDQLPVDSVAWENANAYCAKVGMRLPTEAEYEYAERGGSTVARYAPIAQIAWYKEDAGSTTHEVGLRLPNSFGLYDMLGNVMEWVSDWWSNSYPSSSSQDPQGPSSGRFHVLRGGGGWWSCPEEPAHVGPLQRKLPAKPEH